MPRASSVLVLLLLLLVLLVPGSQSLRDAVVSTPASLPAVSVASSSSSSHQDFAAAPAAPPPVRATDRGIAPPEVTAKGVYAFDLTSGTVLYEKNMDQRRPVASITKVVTALVVVNHATLDEQVSILETDLLDPSSPYTKVGLRTGDTLNVRDLLYGLLLPSGGDAANALARFVGTKLSGSTDPVTAQTAFIDEMNAYVQKLGLKDSFFTDPAGEDDQNAYSTAHDIAMLGGELMKNADLAFIVDQPLYSITSLVGEPYAGTTTNELLGQDGVVGIKTGSTEGAGASVVLARSVNGGQNIIVMAVLGSTLEYDAASKFKADDRYTDAKTIFADMDTRFTWTSLDQTGDTFPGMKEELAVWGVELKDPPVMPLDIRSEDKPSYQLVLLPPTDGGKQAGSILLFAGDSQVGSVPVYQLGGAASVLQPQTQAV